MLQTSLLKRLFFKNLSIILVFGCLVQSIIAAPFGNPNSSVSSLQEDIPVAIWMCDHFITDLQTSEPHQEALAIHRHKRDCEGDNCEVNIVNNIDEVRKEIKVLQTDIKRLNETIMLSKEDKLLIVAFNNSLNSLQNLLEERQEYLEKLIKDNDEKIHELMRILHLVALNDIVRNIQSLQFSFSEKVLQFANDYKYVVNKVYNRRNENFDLVISFGKSIEDSLPRFKVLEALYNEMKDNSHKNIWQLHRLSESLRNITDPSSNTILAESQLLRRSLWNENEDEAVAAISLAFYNEQFGVRVHFLSAEINDACLLCIGNIYKKVIGNVLDELSVTNVLKRASKILVCIDECIFIHEAAYNKLVSNGALYNNATISLAYYMKLTMNKAGYQNVSLEMKRRHEDIKTKLPVSVKNIVFSSAVCLKNSANNEYLFASGPEGAFENGTHSVYTRIPPGVKDIVAQFKWKAEFDDMKELARLINVGNNEFLYTSAEALYNNEQRMVYTGRAAINSTVDLSFEVAGNGLNIKNKYTGEFMYTNSAIKQNNARYVFTYIPKTAPLRSRWEAEDCSNFY